MSTYQIEIYQNGQYVSFDFSPNTPCLLADEIKKLVENYFAKQKEQQPEKDHALTKDDVRRIFDLVRELQTKYSATDGCLQEVADIFNKEKEKETVL